MALKNVFWVEEAKHERVYTLWFHVCETLEKADLIYTESKHVSGCLGTGMTEMGQKVAFCGNGNVIYFYCDYTSV